MKTLSFRRVPAGKNDTKLEWICDKGLTLYIRFMNHLWRVSSGRSWCLCPTMVGYWYVPNSRPWSAIGPHPDAVRHLWSVEGRHVANIFLLLQLELLEVQQSVQRIKDTQSHNVSFGVYSLTLWQLFPKRERNEKKWSATGVFTIYNEQINTRDYWQVTTLVYEQV